MSSSAASASALASGSALPTWTIASRYLASAACHALVSASTAAWSRRERAAASSGSDQPAAAGPTGRAAPGRRTNADMDRQRRRGNCRVAAVARHGASRCRSMAGAVGVQLGNYRAVAIPSAAWDLLYAWRHQERSARSLRGCTAWTRSGRRRSHGSAHRIAHPPTECRHGPERSAILLGKAVTTPESLPDTQGKVFLQARLGNRHGLVAGATGTGKTVTLMTLAEGFSRLGVPVFLADVKGDVAGLAVAGTANEKLQARIAEIGIDRLRARRQPDGVLGPVRQARPPGAHHRQRDGPDPAGAHPRAQRHPARRARHRVQARRRPRPAAARPRGPARPARPGRRGAQGHLDVLRPGQHAVDRRDPARAAAAGVGRRRGVLRRAGAGAGRPHAHHHRRPRRDQHPRRRDR